jgi:hypothetical protein
VALTSGKTGGMKGSWYFGMEFRMDSWAVSAGGGDVGVVGRTILNSGENWGDDSS